MIALFHDRDAINQRYKEFKESNIIIDVKREDLLHDAVSGNKLRKLKYNVLQAQEKQQDTLLTYGGAYSNHIAATAAAGRICGFKTIGIIRGEELGIDLPKTLAFNKTLKTAFELGMRFKFISRSHYKNKYNLDFIKTLKNEFGEFYSIPEGGTNQLAVKGTGEILTDSDRQNYHIICVAAGTGGTAAGIINSSSSDQKVFVFSALKGDFMRDEILKYTNQDNFTVIEDHKFGGYARSNEELIGFMNLRFRESGIPLDPIYTGKMMYGIEQLINTNVISRESRILAIHTGGLQGITGYNAMLRKKGRKLITYEGAF